MSDEATSVDRISRSGPQRHLKGCQGTDRRSPCLSSNDTDCQQMNEAKPRVLDPRPTSNASDQCECEPEDHEDDERRVSYEYQIGS